MQHFTGHRGEVHTLAISPDSRWLASAAGKGKSVALWDLANGKRVTTLADPQYAPHPPAVTTVGFHQQASGNLVLAAGRVVGNYLLLWNVPDGSAPGTVSGEEMFAAGQVVRLPANVQTSGAGPPRLTFLNAWTATIPQPVQFEKTERAATDPRYPYPGLLTTAGFVLWEQIRVFSADESLVRATSPRSAAWEMDRRLICCWGKHIAILEIGDSPFEKKRRGTVEARWQALPVDSAITAVTFCPQGFVTGHANGTVRLWSADFVEQSAWQWDLTGGNWQRPAICGVASSPDGRTLAAGGHCEMMVWDAYS